MEALLMVGGFVLAMIFFFGLAIFSLMLIASGLDGVARWLGR